MSCLYIKTKCFALALTVVTLSGCMGGPIAQQIVTSMISQTADKITSNAYDNYLLNKANERPNVVLKDTEPDRYWGAFVTSGFLPATADAMAADKLARDSAGNDPQQAASSRLVCVEVWNLLLGEEKISVLEKAQLLGATQLPKPEEWARWQVATGSLQTDSKRTITFLIPPDFGKFVSGERAFVEISDVGGLHIARHLAN